MFNNEVNVRLHEALKRMNSDYYIGNIDIVHQEVHLGNFFTVEKRFETVSNNGTARIYLAPDGVHTHVEIFYATTAKTHINSYTGTTFSNAGTEITPFNRNLVSTKTAKTKTYHTPTVTDLGTVRGEFLVGSGTTGATRAGGAGGGRYETIVKDGEVLMIELVNKSGSNADMAIGLNFYEVEA